MKHIKTFEDKNNDFTIAVNVENITIDQVYELIDKLNNSFDYIYSDVEFDLKKLIVQISTPKYNCPWALVFDILNFNNKTELSMRSVYTVGWGEGVDYMERIISLDEFLNTDVDNLKILIDTKKYNL